MIKLPQVLRLNVEDSCISKPLACRLSVRASTSDVQAVFFWGFNMENFDRLNYDPETGAFTWKLANGKFGKAGTANAHGYVQIQYDKQIYLAHRLAWFIFHGKWPIGVIDHINGDRASNEILNLRDVSQNVNLQNQRKASKNSKSGFLGACWDKRKNKWRATIYIDCKVRHLGYFCSAELAHNAYLDAKRNYHDGCTI